MSKLSPYRMLSPERRFALVLYAIKGTKEGRDQFVQRLVSRGGGFRPVTLKSWPADKLAREIVRMKAETPADELELLQMLYVDLEPGIQITYLDAAGVQHEAGRMPESLDPPYTDAESVRRGTAAVREQHGHDGVLYLRTIARYNGDGWPGIEDIITEIDEELAVAANAETTASQEP